MMYVDYHSMYKTYYYFLMLYQKIQAKTDKYEGSTKTITTHVKWSLLRKNVIRDNLYIPQRKPSHRVSRFRVSVTVSPIYLTK